MMRELEALQTENSSKGVELGQNATVSEMNVTQSVL